MEPLNVLSRLWLAIILPWKVLFNGTLAARIAQLNGASAAEAEATLPTGEKTDQRADELPPKAQQPPLAAVEPEADTTAALQLLSILQREGRFIDFLQEDMSGFGDAEIGAAARVVQEGCKRGLAEYLEIVPLRSEAEGDSVTLEAGYDARETRVTGNVTGQPPFRGSLAHHGWRATRVKLPKLSRDHDTEILAPAEVEL